MKRLLILLSICFLTSCVIKDLKPEDCKIRTVSINNISKGSSFDIIFFSNSGDRFYINRGLELGLNLDTLNAKVLNKSVTLHLPKLLGGLIISEHIAQLAVGDEIIFTEFE